MQLNKIYYLNRKLFLAFSLFIVIFLALSVKAHANEVWPGDTWSPGQNANMKIILSRNPNHTSINGTQTSFALYRPGDRDRSEVSTFQFVDTQCGTAPGSRADAWSAADILGSKITFENGSCGEKSINVKPTRTIKLRGGDYTEYRVVVKLYGDRASYPDPNKQARFEFKAKTTYANGFFGYLKTDENNESLPFGSGSSGDRGDPSYFIDQLSLPISSCSAGGTDENKSFKIYDPDNAPEFGVQGTGSNFRNLRFSMFLDGAGRQERKGGSINQPGVSNTWYRTESYPLGNGIIRDLIYFVPKLDAKSDQRAFFNLHNLGKDNYTVLGMPYDEVYSKIGCPDGPTPPNPNNYNWAISTSSDVSSKYVLVGQSAYFTHSLRPASDGSWNSDAASTMAVDANIVRNGSVIDAKSLDVGDISTNAGGYLTKDARTDLNTNTPGTYCESINFPRGELGTRKSESYQKSVPSNPYDYDFRWVFLPGRALPNGSEQGQYHAPGNLDWGKWWLASTVRQPVRDGVNRSGVPYYDTWSGFNFGAQNSYDGHNSAAYWQYNGYEINHPYSSQPVCIEVLRPNIAELPTNEYEKSTTDRTFTHTVSVPGCPATGITVNIRLEGYEGNGAYYNIGRTPNLNPGNDCTYSEGKSLSHSFLNSQVPGKTFDYSTTILETGETRRGAVTVVEVPFARFYGNDIYATNGNITFNDAYNNDAGYDGRGSVVQYAALATGGVDQIDTAAFRWSFAGPFTAPRAPDGLDSTGSYLGNTSATKVYNDVVTKKPIGCLPSLASPVPQDGGRVYGGLSGTGTSICYDLSATRTNVTPIDTNWSYRDKVTIFSSGDLYITKNLVNATDPSSLSQPNKAGIVMLVANNIYIDKNVTRIDAILVANQNIDTCRNVVVASWGVPNFTNVNGSLVSNSNLNPQCRNKLAINGSLSAKKIDFRRVGGSRFLTPSEGNNGQLAGIRGIDGIASLPNESSSSAEIINFPAYLYWASPYLLDESTSGGTNEAMFTAPPRL